MCSDTFLSFALLQRELVTSKLLMVLDSTEGSESRRTQDHVLLCHNTCLDTRTLWAADWLLCTAPTAALILCRYVTVWGDRDTHAWLVSDVTLQWTLLRYFIHYITPNFRRHVTFSHSFPGTLRGKTMNCTPCCSRSIDITFSTFTVCRKVTNSFVHNCVM